MEIPPSNVEMAMSAILGDFKDAGSIACCGLGALTGGLSCEVVARVMKEVYLRNCC
jgi:hypothetical protein